MNALRNLIKNEDIHIISHDKGGGIDIMTRNRYNDITNLIRKNTDKNNYWNTKFNRVVRKSINRENKSGSKLI